MSIVGNANVVTTPYTKWNAGLLDRNWQREFYWLSPGSLCGIFELYRTGVPAHVLLRAGYTRDELLNGGYSEADIK
jgi:hypothetical protein